MAKKLYVGNLPYSVDDEALHQHFAQFGAVDSAKVIMDRESGRSKGFGFVEMADDSAADKAINSNGTELNGRAINVSEARPQEPREGGRGGGRGFGGGRGGGRGGGGRGGGGYGGGDRY